MLKDEPAWNQERILAAMSGATSQRVDLVHPIQVILFYVTVVVMRYQPPRTEIQAR